DRNRPWNNYFNETWFGLVLVNEACRYLAGDATRPPLHFACGRPAALELPHPAPRQGYKYRLQGPDLSESEGQVVAEKGQQAIDLKPGSAPGNYTALDEQGQVLAGVSLDVRPEEGRLERVPVEAIEQALGAKSVLAAGQSVPLREALGGGWSSSFE